MAAVDPRFIADVATVVAAASLALFGVEYHALLWALIGSMFALYKLKTSVGMPGIPFVFVSTFSGAAFASALYGGLGISSSALLVLLSLLAGFSAHKLIELGAGWVAVLFRRLTRLPGRGDE